MPEMAKILDILFYHSVKEFSDILHSLKWQSFENLMRVNTG